jgi:outer membrane murein-binding lipoprotein Lpp
MQDETQKDLLTQMKILTTTVVVQAVVLVAAVVVVAISVLPKVERVTSTAERLEARFQSFANKVEPVVETGAAKAVELIRKIDSELVGEKLTEGVS